MACGFGFAKVRTAAIFLENAAGRKTGDNDQYQKDSDFFHECLHSVYTILYVSHVLLVACTNKYNKIKGVEQDKSVCRTFSNIKYLSIRYKEEQAI